MFCIVFYKGWWGGCPHGVVMVPGWLPVAWGRGCLLIGNSDKPLPEREEGVVEEERGISLDRLSPKGLAGFLLLRRKTRLAPLPWLAGFDILPPLARRQPQLAPVP